MSKAFEIDQISNLQRRAVFPLRVLGTKKNQGSFVDVGH
jgi:hypothetical protein